MSLEPGGPPIKTTPSPFITRVRLREYKSIASCDVALGAFSVLVGPNGSGKSNFLDALALISDALNGSLERALQARGGPQAVHRQPRHSEEPIRMAIEFHPTTESSGQFEVVLETEPGGGFHVLQEVCSLKPNGSSPAAPDYRYRVEGGRVIEWPANDPPVASADSLYLVRVSGVPEFRPAYDALSRIRICGFDPSRIPPVTPPRASDHLAADAGNLPSVIRRLQAESPEIREDIEIYLRSVLPSLRTVEAVAIGNFETLEFVLQTGTGVHRFPVSNISNGTLRALALLVAVLQPASNHRGTASLIGIEEPEKAIHPAAVAALGDAFLDASQATQVMVSTHSPDFLDNEAITSRNVIAVGIRDGVTYLGELDDFGRSVLRDGLFTLSELMRQNHLRPRLPASSVEPQPAGAVPRHDR